MATVKYIEHDGREHILDLKPGTSVMEGAIHNNLTGIEAECGGAMACATCHVYVDPDWIGRLPPRSAAESDMLECAASECRDNSRLSCQIIMGPELDGLVVRLPQWQS